MIHTYGELMEIVKAHLDMDEDEMQSLDLLRRIPIFMNEALSVIATLKPRISVFNFSIAPYRKLVYDDPSHDWSSLRPATIDEINWEIRRIPKPDFADDITIRNWYVMRDIYEHEVTMPHDFIGHGDYPLYRIEDVFGRRIQTELLPTLDWHVLSDDRISVRMRGNYSLTYRASWVQRMLNVSAEFVIELPDDVFYTVPLYVAAQCYQIGHPRKAAQKREEFERALAALTVEDYVKRVRVHASWE